MANIETVPKLDKLCLSLLYEFSVHNYPVFCFAEQSFLKQNIGCSCFSGVMAPREASNGGALPSARDVSITLHRPVYRDDPKFTVMLAVWGQFIDHDITATALSTGGQIKCYWTTSSWYIIHDFHQFLQENAKTASIYIYIYTLCALPSPLHQWTQSNISSCHSIQKRTCIAVCSGKDGSAISCCGIKPNHPECFPIQLSAADRYFNVSCEEFVRSAPAPTCSLGEFTKHLMTSVMLHNKWMHMHASPTA